MAVTEDDVRHVADLARLGLAPAQVRSLVRELNGILEHMGVLSAIEPASYERLTNSSGEGMPLRADEGPQIPLDTPRAAFAPAMRDGFFLVPRLATHESDDEASP